MRIKELKTGIFKIYASAYTVNSAESASVAKEKSKVNVHPVLLFFVYFVGSFLPKERRFS